MGPGPDEIESRRFAVALRGYDRQQVATFLREVAAEHRRLLALTSAGEHDAGFDALGEGFAEAVREAHASIEELQAGAEAEAAAILAAAQRQAEEVRVAADSWVDEQRRRADLDRAEASRSLVEARQQAAGLLEDAAGEVSAIRERAAAEAREWADRVISEAQHRIDYLAASESRIRRRLSSARAELAAALDALDPTDPRRLEERARSSAVDLDLTAPPGSEWGEPNHDGSPQPRRSVDDPFDRMVRDAVARAVRQARLYEEPG